MPERKIDVKITATNLSGPGFDQANKDLGKLTGEAEKANTGLGSFSQRLETLQPKLQSAGQSLTLGLTAPLVGLGAASLKMSTDFNAGMANVASLIPGNTARVGELKVAVQDMAVEMGKSTGDLSAGLYQVESAFGDTADSVSILEINARAATAGLATTTDAINLTSAVTKGYGDTSATAVQQVSDLALKTVQLGQTTFPELAASIGQVTPLTAALGVSQEELFAVMATGTGVTGNAAAVSTQLRGVMQSLMAPTDSMAGLIKKLGFDSAEAMLKQLGLQGTIDAVVKAAQESGAPLQSYIGSIEGQTLAMALSGPQADTFTQKLAAMSEAAGTTDAAFREQTEGINVAGFSMAQFRVKMEVTAQKMGDALAPALIRVLERLTPMADRLVSLIDGFTKLDPTMQTVILGVVGLAAALGPALMIVSQMIPAITMMSAVIHSQAIASMGAWIVQAARTVAQNIILGASWLIALGPIGWIIAGLTVVIGAFVLAWTQNWGDIQGKTKAVVDAVVGGLGWIKDRLGDLVTTVSNAARWIIDNLGEIASYLPLLLGPIGLVQVAWSKNWFDIQGITERVKNAVIGSLRNLWNFISELPGRLAQFVVDSLAEFARFELEGARMMLNAGENLVKQLIAGIGNMAGNLKQSVIDMLKPITDLLPHSPAKSGPLMYLFESGQAIPGELARGVRAGAPQMVKAGEDAVFDMRLATLKGLTQAAEDGATLWVATLGAGLSASYTTMSEFGAGLANSLWAGFSQGIQARAGTGNIAGQFFDQVTGSSAASQMANRAGNWAQGQGSMFRPAAGTITSRPGDSMWYGTHLGYDIAGAAGSPLFAAESGSVHNVYDPNGYGYLTIITTPDGKQFYYGHQPSFSIAEGVNVVAGQQIGRMGSTGNSTGPHLHFEARGPGGQQLDVSRYVGVSTPLGTAGIPESVANMPGVTGSTGAAGTVAAAQTIDPVDAATQMVERLKGAIEVINSINSIVEPTPEALGVFGAAMTHIVEWMQIIANRFSLDGLNAAKTFSDAATPIMDFVGKAIGPINAINTITEPTPEALGVFGGAVTHIVEWMQIVANRFTVEGVNAARVFSEAASSIFDFVGKAIAPIIALNTITEPSGEALGVFGAAVTNITIWMETIAGKFTNEGLAAAGKFAAAGLGIFEFVGKAIAPIEALVDFKAPAQKAVDSFGQGVLAVVQKMGEITGYFQNDLVRVVAEFAAAAGVILDTVGKGIAPLLALQDFKTPTQVSVDAFGEGIRLTVSKMGEITGYFKSELVTITAIFAEEAGKIVGVIGTGVQAFTALQEYKGVPAEVLDQFLADLKVAVTKMIAISGEIDQNMLPQANLFSTAASNIFNVMKGAIDVFAGLRDWKHIPVEVLDDFLWELKETVRKMGEIATVANIEMAAKANAFATATGSVFTVLKNALDLFSDLTKYEDIPSKRMDTLLINIIDAMEKMAPLNVRMANYEEQAKKFFERAWNAYWYIRTGMGMNDQVPKDYVPGSSGYRPEPAPAPGGGGGGGNSFSIPGFADGGIAWSPMVVRVAEKEPEIIIPLSQLGGQSQTLNNITHTGDTYNLTANYKQQDERTLMDEVRLFRLAGAAT